MTKCYVIMPFHKSYNELYLKGILPAVEKCFGRNSCERADREKYMGLITDKIVQGILNAEIIISVITGTNANVMYELGLAHSFRKPTITLISKKKKIPFDISAQEAIFYDYNPKGPNKDIELQSICSHIVEYINNFNCAKCKPTNPIENALKGRNIFVDDYKRNWLWGYREVYEREKSAKTIWEMTPNPHFTTRDQLFNKQIIESIMNGEKKYYYLVPNKGPVIVDMDYFIRSLRDKLGQEYFEKIDKQLKYICLDTEFFDLVTLPIVIYDACYGVKADAIVCEPMSPEVGHDKEFDEMLMNIDVDKWDEIPHTEMWKEKCFDIRLDQQKVRTLTWTFANKWNKQINLEIAQTQDPQIKQFLEINWKI